MTDRQIKRQALSLLKKARRWFNSEDRLVKDWSNFFEYNRKGEICRACVLGGITRLHPESIDVQDEASGRLGRAVGYYHDFDRRHTLKQVHRIYDRAIARLEKELAR